MLLCLYLSKSSELLFRKPLKLMADDVSNQKGVYNSFGPLPESGKVLLGLTFYLREM